jgi:hypothetical protein
MKTLISLSLLSIGLVCNATAFASCTRADLTGTWRIYTVFDSVARCTLVMPASGSTISASSSCYLPGVATSVPITGTLSITTGCHVLGNASVSGEPRKIDAWISRGKDSVSGMVWYPQNSFVGDVFTGIKQ